MRLPALKTLNQDTRVQESFQHNAGKAIGELGDFLKALKISKPGFRWETSNTLLVEASDENPIPFKFSSDVVVVTGNLGLDMRRLGLGGLDRGAAEASKIYYLYAILTAQGVSLVASLTPPENGPFGFGDWTYLGAFSTDSGAGVTKMISCNGLYMSPAGPNVTVNNASPATAKTLLIPLTAKAVYLRAFWTAVNAVGDDLAIGALSSDAQNRFQATSTTIAANPFGWLWIAVLEAQRVYANVTTATTDSVTLNPFGWKENPEEWR